MNIITYNKTNKPTYCRGSQLDSDINDRRRNFVYLEYFHGASELINQLHSINNTKHKNIIYSIEKRLRNILTFNYIYLPVVLKK